MLPHTTKRRITTNLKPLSNQKCHKNQTAWNSNNEEVKETFTQTGRRGTDKQLRGEDVCKATDCRDEAGLAKQETEDSKLAVKYCGSCNGRRNSQSHRRVYGKVGLEQSK